jgi:hypothetical protein
MSKALSAAVVIVRCLHCRHGAELRRRALRRLFKLKARTSSFQNANATTKACRIYGERNQAADRYADRAQAQFRFVTIFATSLDWFAVRVQALADQASAAVSTVTEVLQRHAAGPLAWAGPHRREIAVAVAATVIFVVAIWALRSLRRGRQLEGSLAEATLDRDTKTHGSRSRSSCATCSRTRS